MKALICEMCASPNLIKKDGVYVCENCGTRYTVEEAKKMIIEGSVDVSGSTVKVDTSAELKNLYELARRARTDNNFENAQKYYEQIIVKDPSSWEATFYATYFQSMNCKIGEIRMAAQRVSNCENTVFTLIKENVTDPDEQRKAVNEIATKLISVSNMLFDSYRKYFYDNNIKDKVYIKYTNEYVNHCSAARDIVYNGGNLIIKVFGDVYGDIAAACWTLGVKQHSILANAYKDYQEGYKIIGSYNEKISKYNPSYKPPERNNNGGCYVATTVYGSYDCPQVWTLRRYRDYTLAKTWYGRVFIHTYYAISPTIVKWFGNTSWFKDMWKPVLDRMIIRLNTEGVESTPYSDRKW